MYGLKSNHINFPKRQLREELSQNLCILLVADTCQEDKRKKKKQREYAFSDSFLSLGLESIQMRSLNKRDQLSSLTRKSSIHLSVYLCVTNHSGIFAGYTTPFRDGHFSLHFFTVFPRNIYYIIPLLYL